MSSVEQQLSTQHEHGLFSPQALDFVTTLPNVTYQDDLMAAEAGGEYFS
jgi:hypothetical protein